MKPLKMFILIIIFLSSVLLVKTAVPAVAPLQQVQEEKESVALLPILEKEITFPVLSAQGVLVIDADSAVTLYEKNADHKLLPASTTKIMTALVSLKHFNKEDIVTVPPHIVIGQKMKLLSGEKITVESLLDGLLMYSANDAAEVLASHYPGGRSEFVKEMNRYSKELNLKNTQFKNPSGLDEDGHFSTAKDMVRLSQIAMRDPYFATIVATKEKIVKSTDGLFIHPLKNINELLGKVDGVKGIKTGWTEAARENLITYVERDNKKLFIALLGSSDRFGETEELIEWIFSSYKWIDVYDDKIKAVN